MLTSCVLTEGDLSLGSCVNPSTTGGREDKVTLSGSKYCGEGGGIQQGGKPSQKAWRGGLGWPAEGF